MAYQIDPDTGRRKSAGARKNAIPADCRITVGDEDSPSANERLITFQALDMNGYNIDTYVQATVSVHSAKWGAVDGDTAMSLDGDTTGTLVAAVTANKVYVILSDSDGTITIKLTDAGNDTFYVRCDYGAGYLFQTEAITFGTG